MLICLRSQLWYIPYRSSICSLQVLSFIGTVFVSTTTPISITSGDSEIHYFVIHLQFFFHLKGLKLPITILKDHALLSSGRLKFIRKETWKTSCKTLPIKDHLKRCMSLTQFALLFLLSADRWGEKRDYTGKGPISKHEITTCLMPQARLALDLTDTAWAELCKMVQQANSKYESHLNLEKVAFCSWSELAQVPDLFQWWHAMLII